MAESKGWAKQLRRVTRGGAVSTSSPERAPSNMRDWSATMERYSTRMAKWTHQSIRRLDEFPNRGISERRLLLRGFSFGSGVRVFLSEALDASGSIYELLLASEKRVAAGANFNAQGVALDRGARGERVPAGAMYGDGVIIGMNTGFHEAPIRRVRSARRYVAASLGREAVFYYTRPVHRLLTGERILVYSG